MKKWIIGLCLAASPFCALADADNSKALADIYTAEANYLQQTQRPMQAITRLQEVLDTQLLFSNTSQTELKLQSLRSQIAWGMHFLPATLYQQMLDVRGTNLRPDNKIWLDLAELQYRRGYWGLTGGVEYSLSRTSKNLNRADRAEQKLLQSLLYLEQGRNNKADATLERLRGSRLQEAYAEYNRAIALIRAGDTGRGTALLEKVGDLPSYKDELMLALRDLANLTLGTWYVSNDQGGTAIPILKRVRLEGPYSNKALLNLGWAYLSASGGLQSTAEVYSNRCLSRLLAKSGMVVSGNTSIEKDCRPAQVMRIENETNDNRRLENALAAWSIVQERSPLYPGVQETLMALPFALDKLGYTAVAQDYYRGAIKSLDYETQRINDALDVVHQQQLLASQLPAYNPEFNDQAWSFEPVQLSQKLDSRLLYEMYAQHEFYEALINYRQLRRLQSHLAERIQQFEQPRRRYAPTFTRGRPSLNLRRDFKPQSIITLVDGKKLAQDFAANVVTRGLVTQLAPRKETKNKRKSNLSIWSSHKKTAHLPWSQRSYELRPKLKTLYKQVNNLGDKTASYLHQQTEEELKAKLDRVNLHAAQARLQLGRIHDRLADEQLNSSNPNN